MNRKDGLPKVTRTRKFNKVEFIYELSRIVQENDLKIRDYEKFFGTSYTMINYISKKGRITKNIAERLESKGFKIEYIPG